MDTIQGKYYLRGNDLREDYEFDGNFIDRGKNLYEVVRVIDGTILFLEDHLERLYASAKKLELRPFVEQPEIKKLLKRMIKSNQMTSGNIKIIFHYGFASEKTFMAYPVPYCYPSPEDYENGIKAGIMEYTRPTPEVKYWLADFKEKVKDIRGKNQWYEVLLKNENGIITEGSQSNLFVIKGKKLHTAPENIILHGVTRNKVMAVAAVNSIKIEEKPFNEDFLLSADSVFITGTSPKVLPVNHIGDKEFGVKNPILRKIMDGYDEKILEYIEANRSIPSN